MITTSRIPTWATTNNRVLLLEAITSSSSKAITDRRSRAATINKVILRKAAIKTRAARVEVVYRVY